MCLPLAGAAAGSAAAVSATTAVIGTMISAVGTAAGIMQAQQQQAFAAAQYQHQVEMQNQQTNLQYQQAQHQAYADRKAQAAKHAADVRRQQAQTNVFHKQQVANAEAAGRVYEGEQNKINEARTKMMFERQALLAKSIGAKGSVLATGATGQSVGLLAADADRQYGFEAAQQEATLESAIAQSTNAMDGAFLQQQSADNQAASQVEAPVQAPQFAQDPMGQGTNLNLGIPTYNWV